MSSSPTKLISRPPVIVIMGHIDHGKSTLLDYIRKTNVVASEAGGITQHISAYEVLHELPSGEKKKITFLDTPGHAAFQSMRARGAVIADVAVLVVSAEDGVKPQTLEALAAITAAKLPYIIAITKTDKANANVDRVRQDLATHNIFVEGYGGTVPCVPISAKTGAGVDELLDIVLLSADLGEHTANPLLPAEGVVIEATVDPRRGASATLLIRNGTMKKGDVLVSEGALSPIRSIEDHTGKGISEATVSAPVRVLGCSFSLTVGARFATYHTKKDAEQAAVREQKRAAESAPDRREIKSAEVPLLLRADVAGSMEALLHELMKCATSEVGIHVIQSGVGPISETDVKLAAGSNNPLLIGFHVKAERGAQTYAEQLNIKILTFDVIYDIVKAVTEEVERRRPRVISEQSLGTLKIIKVFNRAKDKQVVGGAVLDGKLSDAGQVKIMRHEKEIGRGKIVELQAHKLKVKEVEAPNQCGVLIDAKMTIAPGDTLTAFTLIEQ